MKKLFPLAALAAVAAGVWLYLTPYLAIDDLREAAEAGDTQTLNEMVDFPAFRESVKTGVKTAVAREIGDDGNPLARLGGWFAGQLASPMVDVFVSPEGIAALTRGERPDQDGARGSNDRDGASEDGDRVRAPKLEMRREYEGMDRFIVHFHDPESGEERFSLVMEREGIAGWELTGFRLPEKRAAE